MRPAGALALALGVMALGACSSAAPEPGDWAVAVPAGTRIIEQDPVPPEERTVRIELIEDFVIGERGEDVNYLFGRTAPKLAVDADGRIYALDSRVYRVQVFSREGDYLRTIGRRGQGPGEFDQPRVITVAGETLVVSQEFGAGSIAWTLDGEYLYDLDIEAVPRRASGTGLADGTFVGGYHIPDLQGATMVVARRDTTGAETHRYIELRGNIQVAHASHPSGAVYVSTIQGARQQITAFTAAGDVRWAIRTSSRTGSETVALKTAGDGDLYMVWPCGPDLGERCADVYSPQGDRRLAARMADVNLDIGWQAADEQYVYGADRDPVSDEWRIVRYRLAESIE